MLPAMPSSRERDSGKAIGPAPSERPAEACRGDRSGLFVFRRPEAPRKPVLGGISEAPSGPGAPSLDVRRRAGRPGGFGRLTEQCGETGVPRGP
jgi:hypothetical protein